MASEMRQNFGRDRSYRKGAGDGKKGRERCPASERRTSKLPLPITTARLNLSFDASSSSGE